MPNGPNKTAQQDKTGSHDPTQPLTLLKSPGYHLTTYQSHTSSQHIGQAPAPLLRAPPHPERFRTSVLRYLATTPPTTLDMLVSPRCLVGQPGAAIAQVRLPADQLNPGPCGVPGFSAPTSRKGTCRRTRCRRGCPPRQAPRGTNGAVPDCGRLMGTLHGRRAGSMPMKDTASAGRLKTAKESNSRQGNGRSPGTRCRL